MIDHFVKEHESLSIVILVALIVLLGYLEKACTKRLDIACITWFFADLIGSVGIVTVEELGVWRWSLSAGLFIVWTTFLIVSYRRSNFRAPDFSDWRNRGRKL
jgi:hypothetical protein